MAVIVLQIVGWAAFIGGTLLIGRWLRQRRDKASAERSSRVMQGSLLRRAGDPRRPGPALSRVSAIRCALRRPAAAAASPDPGRRGRPAGGRPLPDGCLPWGAAALGPRRQRLPIDHPSLWSRDIYRHTRNPMSLGYYLSCISVGLLAGSTTITVFALIAIIPAHLLYLIYFEELEVALRLGPAYLAYQAERTFSDSQEGHMSEAEFKGAIPEPTNQLSHPTPAPRRGQLGAARGPLTVSGTPAGATISMSRVASLPGRSRALARCGRRPTRSACGAG